MNIDYRTTARKLLSICFEKRPVSVITTDTPYMTDIVVNFMQNTLSLEFVRNDL